MTSRPTERAVIWGDWLRALTDAQREAVRLCWVEGCTMREAGDVLGIAHTSIQSRLDWARRKYGVTVQERRCALFLDKTL